MTSLEADARRAVGGAWRLSGIEPSIRAGDLQRLGPVLWEGFAASYSDARVPESTVMWRTAS